MILDALFNTFTAMRYLTADFVFPIHSPPISKGVLVVDHNGKITDVLDPEKDDIPTTLPLERLTGILCPGFVNSHCHLELSHLKGMFSQKKGLPEFIDEMVEKRNGNKEKILQAMTDADSEMFAGGIVAVGDISNETISSDIKLKSKIFYHTFVELFDIFPERTDSVFEKGLDIQKYFSEKGLNASIVPHSHYTVTFRLMKLIYENAKKSANIFCIHNQETIGENEMFEKGTGLLIEKLQELTQAYTDWKPSGKSSLITFIEKFNPTIPIQLVHNTFATLSDVRSTFQNKDRTYWCFCVNANLFIENKLPDIPLFTKEKCILTVGTDSYASNTSLSILKELITIGSNYPEISLTEMLTWATLNGANFLHLENQFGSFEKGKKPGILLISNIDLKQLRLKNESKIHRLI